MSNREFKRYLHFDGFSFDEKAEESENLDLDKDLVVIENTINMKKGDFISKSNICSLIGVDLKGYKQLLNIYEDKVNNNRYWLDCFENLKSRGIKNILFLFLLQCC